MADGPSAAGSETIEALKQQLQTAIAERDELRAQQTATAEILRVI